MTSALAGGGGSSKCVDSTEKFREWHMEEGSTNPNILRTSYVNGPPMSNHIPSQEVLPLNLIGIKSCPGGHSQCNVAVSPCFVGISWALTATPTLHPHVQTDLHDKE